ncbi:glycoside hydrolase family 68 protein [Rhodococcus sp. ZPP]|uniref:glycoside hydrolase family 68 protein n=1 Tax=Rhodococcus sp. ZPP TaxID=2749906 RepID=UPI001FCBC6A9|nr:glycoside hydrolase family 68 protein [Rhodococcus sp. ZPP]
MMRLALPDHWVWDSWMTDDGTDYHLFFLRASRALQDRERRHYRATIGHATSPDGEAWTLTADALAPSDAPAFDDLATWTGSVVRGADGLWNMFYTGVSRAENGLKQRIGRATSTDLLSWTKDPDLVLEADGRWYELLGDGTWPDEAWRDPYVFEHAGQWHMLITARACVGDPEGRAVVGHATSADLSHWRIEPPLSTPAGFGEMEVLQAHTVNAKPILLFSCAPKNTSLHAGHDAGTWIAEGQSLLGPWTVTDATNVDTADLYAVQMRRTRNGNWMTWGFDNTDGPQFGTITSSRYSPHTDTESPTPAT